MKKPNNKIVLLVFTVIVFLSCNTYKPAVIGESIEKYKSTWNKNKENKHPELYYQDSLQIIYFYCTNQKKYLFSYVDFGGTHRPVYNIDSSSGIYYTFKNGICVAINQGPPIKISTK